MSQVFESRVEKHRCFDLVAVEVLFARKRGADDVLPVELVDARADEHGRRQRQKMDLAHVDLG